MADGNLDHSTTRMTEDMIQVSTQYYSNMQKLNKCTAELGRKYSKFDSFKNKLQTAGNVSKEDVLQAINESLTDIDNSITVTRCGMSIINQLYETLVHSLQMKDDCLREKSEECQQLKREREEFHQMLEHKEDNIEQLKIAEDKMTEELVNLRECNEDASTQLIVLNQEFEKLKESLELCEQEKMTNNSKYETQQEELKKISTINEQLSNTLNENAGVIKQLIEDAQTKDMYLQELLSIRTTKEVVNEQLEKELHTCREELHTCREKIEQLERDNWALINSLTDTTRQFQANMDRATRIKGDNKLLKNQVVLLATTKEKLELDLWDTNRKLDDSVHALRITSRGRRDLMRLDS